MKKEKWEKVGSQEWAEHYADNFINGNISDVINEIAKKSRISKYAKYHLINKVLIERGQESERFHALIIRHFPEYFAGAGI